MPLLQPGGGQSAGSSSAAAAAWQRLRRTVERYDGASSDRHHGALRVAAAAGILSEDAAMELPPWLLALLGSPPLPSPAAAPGVAGAAAYGTWAGVAADPAALLRLYMQHGRLEDAVALVVEYFAAWQTTNPLVRRKEGQPDLWVPGGMIARLAAALAEAAQRARQAGSEGASDLVQRMERASAKLEGAVQQHNADTQRDLRRRDQGRPLALAAPRQPGPLGAA